MRPKSAVVEQLYRAALDRIEAVRNRRPNVPSAIVDFNDADRESCIAFGALLSEEFMPRLRNELALTDAQALVLLLDMGFGLGDVAVYDNRGGLEVVVTPRTHAFMPHERDSLRLSLLVCVESFVSRSLPGSVLIAGGTDTSISVRAVHPLSPIPQPLPGV